MTRHEAGHCAGCVRVRQVITADEQVRGDKHLPLKAIVDEAIALGGCDSVKDEVVYRRTGAPALRSPGSRCATTF